jgi:hypothetical protein
MSTQHPGQRAEPGWGLPPQPPKPKPFYKRTWFIVTAAIVSLGLLGLILLGALIGAIGEGIEDAASPSKTVQQASPSTAPEATDAPADDENPYDRPSVRDFQLKVKELDRSRFGSAGDNVDYRVDLIQVTSKTYDPDKSYELTFSLKGGDSGLETHTMLIQGDSYEPYEGYASTKSGVKLVATPKSIEEV